jgi:hypothetical protein
VNRQPNELGVSVFGRAKNFQSSLLTVLEIFGFCLPVITFPLA